MSTVIKEINTEIDQNGGTRQSIHEKVIDKDREPEYIKIYVNMWFEFKQFPAKYRELFLQLAMRMSYCNSLDPEESQIVHVSGITKKKIREACGWKTDNTLSHGLDELCKCGAIRRVSRGIYQINPSFAGKGSWRYNNKENTGGIKEFKVYFDLTSGDNDVNVVYFDDDDDKDD